MKYVLPLFVLVLLAGGCQTSTLSPEDFLYAYRCGSLPNEPTGGSALYDGNDNAYRYLVLKNNTPSQVMFGDLSGQRRVRCRIDQLPEDFPAGFQRLGGEESFEASEETRQYVQEYLQRNMGKKAAPAPPPAVPPAPTPQKDWNDD
jgi:hypothetical protein